MAQYYEADARTTKGLFGEAESRTVKGLIYQAFGGLPVLFGLTIKMFAGSVLVTKEIAEFVLKVVNRAVHILDIRIKTKE